jgi:hypothetical protein
MFLAGGDMEQITLSAVRVLVGLCIPFLCGMPTRAADIITTKADDGSNVIYISGEIDKDDADKFKRITSVVTGRTVVFLDSKGGSAMDGLYIGEYIRYKGYSTAVGDNTDCASACGLIWLAGQRRYLGTSARVGFHAAYTVSGDDARESGVANAVIGGYLTKLGLSFQAIVFATVAPPDEIKWLSPDDAKRIGIQYSGLSGYKLTRPKVELAPSSATIPFVACMAAAAAFYHLPPRLLPAMQVVEGGRPGLVHPNADGSSNLGLMQISTIWVGTLASYANMTKQAVYDRLVDDPCFNIAAAAAIMQLKLSETRGDLMQATGKYHSDDRALGRTYQKNVIKAAQSLFKSGP